MVVVKEASMSDKTNYCTTKDLGKAFAIIAFFMVGVPILLADQKYCKQSIILPCFPWAEVE